MAKKTVDLVLLRRDRQVGPRMSASLDWPEDSHKLRGYLLDAVKRAGYPADRVGEFELEVTAAGRVLTRFVATTERGR